MEKHILFFVHGMGTFEKNWSTDLGQELSEIFDSHTTNGNFSDFYEVIEVRYDHLFTQYLDDYRQNAKTFVERAELLKTVDNELVREFVSLASANPTENFFTSHVLDVLLYVLTLKQHETTAHIANEIQARLQKRNHTGWSIVCHSLGTRGRARCTAGILFRGAL